MVGKGVSFSGIVTLAPLGKDSSLSVFRKVFDLYGPIGTWKIFLKYARKKFSNKNLDLFSNNMECPLIIEKDINNEEFVAFASEQDLIVSVAASKIFSSQLLEAPRLGCINIHSGPLPQFRGMMPVFWQLQKGRTNIGITIHYIDQELDHGSIIRQDFVDVRGLKSLDECIKITKKYGARMVAETLCNFPDLGDDVLGVQNDDTKATYYSFPTKRDAKTLTDRGIKLV